MYYYILYWNILKDNSLFQQWNDAFTIWRCSWIILFAVIWQNQWNSEYFVGFIFPDVLKIASLTQMWTNKMPSLDNNLYTPQY